MIHLPEMYQWLNSEPSPKILLEALKLHGTREVPGPGSNLTITDWAKELGGWEAGYYNDDGIPWCGLFMAVCAKRAGLDPVNGYLRALAWAAWGKIVKQPMLGDVLTFKREGGGHVGLYVGEDAVCYHVLGGNQADSVSITRISKFRLYSANRTSWKIAQPENVRQVHLQPEGKLSHNEA